MTEIVNNPLLLLLSGALLAILVTVPLFLFLFRKTSQGTGGEGRLLDQEGLRRLEELSGKMEALGRIFIVPRSRGGLGETLLEELLRNWLPRAAWRRQYRFSDGTVADAVIRTGSFLVAVDAKFPLEQVGNLLQSQGEDTQEQGGTEGGSQDRVNPDRTVPNRERRIFLNYGKSISEKYIRPAEGTLEFALLYLPSEHLYYRCFVEDPGLGAELWNYRVIPVSPSSLFLYLQTVALGLKGLQLPERARELSGLIGQLRNQLSRLEAGFATSSGHLKNLQKSFDESRGNLMRMALTTERLEGKSLEEEQEAVPPRSRITPSPD